MKQITKWWAPAVLSFFLIAPNICISKETITKTSAIQVIKDFNSTLLHVMKNAKSLNYSGRYETLKPVLVKAFDFSFMIKYAVGQPWKALTKDPKQKLIEAFTDFTIATYADRFNGYSGEKIEIKNKQDGPRGTKLVKTELVKQDGSVIKLNYLLRKNERGWQIIDIFLKGSISELATKRSEYNATVKKNGLNGLIERIKEKTVLIKAQNVKSK